MKIVALEEHYATAEVMQAWKSVDPRWSDLALKPSTEGEDARRLLDLGGERLDAMNQAGIDVAVLSLTTTLNDKRLNFSIWCHLLRMFLRTFARTLWAPS
jgi:hypothetical protein